MGEVYRARDTKLGRDVALKILPDTVAQDPDRIARFKREAQVLAALNHPNIAAIYGLEESGGITALVMELVEGEDLSQRIARGMIPIDEALSIAKQVAEALVAAHERDVIHRDVKPANIKLRPDGKVKVLDFGLAKAWEPTLIGSPNVSQSPTITSPAMTQAGVILGTAAYMSPEQARGKTVDKQADIWAFGCVLYEMLTGQAAFAGETVSDTIARTLEREPEWRALPAQTPAKVSELLHRCLEKDRRRRLLHIADARIKVDEALTGLGAPRLPYWVPAVAGASGLALVVAVGTWWYAGRSVQAGPHTPVAVVVSDLENRTSDPTFDGALEPVQRMVLEGASFINAYDKTRVSGSLGIPRPEVLNERAAADIAVKQGLGVIVSSTLSRRGSGFAVSMKATEAPTGIVIAQVEGTASDKDQVLSVVTNLTTAVRRALGDNTSDHNERFAMETISATSLEAIHAFALGQLATADGRFDDAITAFSSAISRDPKFGSAWAARAMAFRNLGKNEEAERQINEALRYLDGMTERERLRVRGAYFLIAGDNAQGVKEYEEMIARYPADAAAHNNLALLLAHQQSWSRALGEMREAVRILPKRALYRINLALYANYSGDFQTGEREARAISEPGVFGLLALAHAQLGQGQIDQATDTYKAIAKLGSQGASIAASGLGDLALYRGRLSDAAEIFTRGAAADLESKVSFGAAHKFTALAYTELLRRQPRLAVAAVNKALENNQSDVLRLAAARVLVEAGEIGRAEKLAAELASESQARPDAYGKIVEAEIALTRKDARRAIKLLIDANSLWDSWIGHFDLGRAYLDAGQLPEADSEFERCLRRRGDVLALHGGDLPTFRHLPPVYYYQGRVREELKTEGFAESYRTYLRIREKAGEDPLIAEVRRRAGL